MNVILHLESVDDDPEEHVFQTVDDAIEYAKVWFIHGYENDTINEDVMPSVREDAERLEADLRAGSEFHCSRFHETVSLEQGSK